MPCHRSNCLLPFLVLSIVGAFQASFRTRSRQRRPSSIATQFLVPISTFRDDLTFLSKPEERCCLNADGRLTGNEEYVLGIMEKSDLPDVAKFVVESFPAEAVALGTDLNQVELLLLKPPTDLLNAYSGVVALAEVYSGIQNRCKDKLDNPTLQLPPIFRNETSSPEDRLTVAQQNSVILALAKPNENEDDWRTEVVATVELRLQPCDAKIPFTLPLLDKIERRLASLTGMKTSKDLQPYLSNLSVKDEFRGKQIGKALCRCLEDIAFHTWGCKRLYLHVDLDNEPALKLYEKEGYKDASIRWRTPWAGKASSIGYFVKKRQ